MTDLERKYMGGPLLKLWDDTGEFGRCMRDTVTGEDIRILLREISIKFVEIDVGRPPRWMSALGAKATGFTESLA